MLVLGLGIRDVKRAIRGERELAVERAGDLAEGHIGRFEHRVGCEINIDLGLRPLPVGYPHGFVLVDSLGCAA
jgi:hypothetical protein